jgi:hypothetical protein
LDEILLLKKQNCRDSSSLHRHRHFDRWVNIAANSVITGLVKLRAEEIQDIQIEGTSDGRRKQISA